jgi:hypothetical protein
LTALHKTYNHKSPYDPFDNWKDKNENKRKLVMLMTKAAAHLFARKLCTAKWHLSHRPYGNNFFMGNPSYEFASLIGWHKVEGALIIQQWMQKDTASVLGFGMPSQASICSVKGYMDHGIGRPRSFHNKAEKEGKKKRKRKRFEDYLPLISIIYSRFDQLNNMVLQKYKHMQYMM